MSQELISKKELLELTGISYGQLYRWKRKQLIPEEWFIRKSTFTGQETFFPKVEILARVHRIKNMKEDLSLDELAEVFSPAPGEIALSKDEVLANKIAEKFILDYFVENFGDAEVYPFDMLLYIFILNKVLHSGEISLEEGKILIQTLLEHHQKIQGKPSEVIFLRKMGVSFCMLVEGSGQVYLDKGTRILTRIDIARCIEELKLKVTL